MCLPKMPDPPKMPEIPELAPPPSPMYKDPDPPEFRVRNPGLVIKNKK